VTMFIGSLTKKCHLSSSKRERNSEALYGQQSSHKDDETKIGLGTIQQRYHCSIYFVKALDYLPAKTFLMFVLQFMCYLV